MPIVPTFGSTDITRLGPCSNWINTGDLTCSGVDATDPDQLAALSDAAEIASSVLYHLSQGRFPGLCTAREALCSHRAPCGAFWNLLPGGGPSWDASGWEYDYAYGGSDFGYGGGYGGYDFGWDANGCTGRTPCDCTRPERVLLPYRPVSEIIEITIDGVVVDPTTYRLVENQWLYRCDGSAWPSCSNRCSGASGLIGEWAYGVGPPPEGVRAAKVLACELAKSDPRIDGDCNLPSRITSITRQGVSMTILDPLVTSIKDGTLGLFEVALFTGLWGGAASSITFPEQVDRIRWGERGRVRW